MNLFVIFFATLFTHNIALTYFLGMCPFISVSRSIKTALGMGLAVVFVMTVTAAINWPIYYKILVPLEVEFLYYVLFIITIAALVQFVEMVTERFLPVLQVTLGVFLPLITVNCAILGVSLFMVLRKYSYLESVVFAFGSGVGWTIAIIAMSGIRSKLLFADIPEALKGPGITMIIASIMALAFMGFAGMVGI
ncbi:MAG: NADH:ubiquinone reductase (Na(+)-transporting) subunit E [Omnitrophica bacterium]|nr:NADH:ubiquinone reductase (Na(+)-transporting) subunit E [Candidatus Omnitrophota bacterium]